MKTFFKKKSDLSGFFLKSLCFPPEFRKYWICTCLNKLLYELSMLGMSSHLRDNKDHDFPRFTRPVQNHVKVHNIIKGLSC